MSEWRKFVKQHYNKMKKSNRNISLGDAMKSASKVWKTLKNKSSNLIVMSNTKKHRKSMRKTRRTSKR